MKSISLSVSKEIYTACPQFEYAIIQCQVENSQKDEDLWKEIYVAEKEIQNRYKIEDIKKIPSIYATRQIYKALGKDPNRYRPSAEALCRRIVKTIGLYQIDTLVDLINLVSFKTGYSIGGFDVEKIQGNIVLGVGRKDEPFEGIGRGVLNIEGLPVYRDEVGGIGTPTSDNERTKISLETTYLLMIINGYSGKEGLQEAVDLSKKLLEKYAKAIFV